MNDEAKRLLILSRDKYKELSALYWSKFEGMKLKLDLLKKQNKELKAKLKELEENK